MRIVVRVFQILGVMLLLASSARAFPRLVNYQGVLSDASGVPLVDGAYSVVFRIFNAPTSGAPLWEETQNVTTQGGLFNVLLGSLVEVPDSAFANDSWLSTSVEGDPELTPRTQIVSVGYAFRANNAERLGGVPPAEFVRDGDTGSVSSPMIEDGSVSLAKLNVLVGTATVLSNQTSASIVDPSITPTSVVLLTPTNAPSASHTHTLSVVSPGTGDPTVNFNGSQFRCNTGGAATTNPGNDLLYYATTANGIATITVTRMPGVNLTFRYVIFVS